MSRGRRAIRRDSGHGGEVRILDVLQTKIRRGAAGTQDLGENSAGGERV